ncbi:MAG: hypothetical protein ACC628_26545, partial [Pirellulaceae bacterium]
LTFFDGRLRERIKEAPADHAPKVHEPQRSVDAIRAKKRKFGTPARVRIVAARRKGGYDVQEEGKPTGTLTLGPEPAPSPKIDDVVDVEVHNDDPKRPQYRWPTPADDKPKKTKKGRR